MTPESQPAQGDTLAAVVAELLPCPFCGGDAIMETVHGKAVDEARRTVGCRNEECHGYMSFLTHSRQCEAAAAWNTRADRLEKLVASEAAPLAAVPVGDAEQMAERACAAIVCEGENVAWNVLHGCANLIDANSAENNADGVKHGSAASVYVRCVVKTAIAAALAQPSGAGK